MNKYIWFILICFYTTIGFLFSELRFLSREYGLIENITVALYFVSIIFSLLYFFFYRSFVLIQIIAIQLILLARELDCHKSLTSQNVLKFKFYFTSSEEIKVKVFTAVLVSLCIGYSVFLFYIFISQLKHHKEKVFIKSICSIFFIVVFSFSLEMIKSFLRKLVQLTMEHRAIFRYVEECLEMAIPIFICLAIFEYFRSDSLSKEEV